MRRLRMTLLWTGLSLAGCSTAPKTTTVLEEDVGGHRLVVELEPLQPEASRRFAHPVVGDAQPLAVAIDGFLAELAYGRPKGKRLVRLMQPEDRQRLAAALARGLTDAGPQERVRFLLIIDDGAQAAWFTADERLTRGVAFIDEGGRFHLAFDLLDDRVDPDDLDPHDPTERAQTRARLVSETGAPIGPQKDGKRRLWVTWALLPPSIPTGAVQPDAPQASDPPTSSAVAGKLELLDELLRDEIIDREEYERRRSRLGAPEHTETSPESLPETRR